MDCKNVKNLITLSLYGELDEKNQAVLDLHIQECRACAAELEYTKKVFKLLDRHQRAPAAEPNWERSWLRIQSAISRPQARARRLYAPGWRWVYASSALAAVLILGIFLGRYWLAQSQKPMPTVSQMASSLESFQPALSAHLEDIKPMLLEYAHYTPGDQGATKILVDEKMVRGLLIQNLLLKRALARKDPAAAEFLDDLDLVLKEIANRTENDRQAPSLIKSYIDEKGLLYKMEMFKKL